MARVLPPTLQGLSAAGRVLREGGLVAFPTETVYGLGANALQERAVLEIFKAKGRPLTDPLIVHVGDADKALALLEISGRDRSIFEYLAARFWPGPLTLVAKGRLCFGPLGAERLFALLQLYYCSCFVLLPC